MSNPLLYNPSLEEVIERLDPINIDAVLAKMNYDRTVTMTFAFCCSIAGAFSYFVLDGMVVRGLGLFMALTATIALIHLIINRIEKSDIVASQDYITTRMANVMASQPLVKAKFNRIWEAQEGILLKRQVDALVENARYD